MAEIILSPTAEWMIETLGSAAVEEIKSLWGVEDGLEELKQTLETIKAVLADAEKQQIREEHVKLWLQRLEAVFYEADDLVDEVGDEALRRQLIQGLGKTTLADQLVFNDGSVQRHFDLRISDDFSLKVLCEKIVKTVTDERVENLEMEQLQRKLRKQINGKHYLLVLDDVWSEDPGKWQDFKGLLRADCAVGSKIIVTARNEIVVDVMGTTKPYYLGVLDSEDSWNLFEKMAFHQRKELTQPDTVDAAKKIVGKCKGLPLAISMIGSMLLRSRDPEADWPSFLENELSNLTQKDEGILSTLKLSSVYLPSHLKPCFAYCSLFPKDHEFDVQTLVF